MTSKTQTPLRKPSKQPTTQGRAIKPFLALLATQAPKVHPNGVPTTLLCIDPGHTTGWCSFVNGKPSKCGQIEKVDEDPGKLDKLLIHVKPTLVVYEEFILYPWRMKQQSWSELKTVQIIGVLRHLCRERNIPTHSQGANIAKGFTTDDKLKAWGFYQSGQRHSRDAMRHGCQYLLFGPTRCKTRKPPDNKIRLDIRRVP